MPFNRPTLTEHRNSILQNMQSANLPGATNITRFSVLGVFAKVWAGMAHLHDAYLDWIAKQGVPWTATGENLEGWGNLKGITRKAASPASGTVTFQAVANTTLPVGSEISLGNVGTATTTEAATADETGQVTLPVRFSTPGASGNVPLGTVATLANPIIGVQSSGLVSTAFTGGADLEDEEAFRARILTAYQTAGKNGRAQDYVDWALAVPGVTRAWVNPDGFGIGSVVVYVMLDNANAAQGGFPIGKDGSATAEKRYHTASGDQLTVANAINDLRPVTALVIVCAPIAQPIDFIISGLGADNTATTQAAISNALNDAFRRASGPGATVYPSTWNGALDALNLPQYSVQSPSGPVIAETVGRMPILGNISFRT
ncbi:hypothetical protein GS535_03665 [Saccharibacter sp. EH611]|uniref:baseplate J/gp47 family protein n=1 Tax=unclassified Saccharibacter TaxID=2648722 RepID=UPI001326FCA1|nr:MULTISPECIES: baseplate J/gp47 family protein [unclassified Saccharibacter]MXV35655.1 hypothetical protein [Saccharibacter sp. EH611]MXV65733.1 hypothetical protein [Saccharibacter sp. EH60]